jgi:hypothetical protein
MSVTVSVRDEQTGEIETQRVEDGDYLVIVTAPAYIGHVQTHRMGRTHVVTIKDRVPRPLREAPDGR